MRAVYPKLFIVLLCAINYSPLNAQNSSLSRLKREYDSLTNIKRKLTSDVELFQGYLETLEDIENRLDEVKEIKRKAPITRAELIRTNASLDAISKQNVERLEQYEIAKGKVESLNTKLKIESDTATARLKLKNRLSSISARESKTEKIKRKIYGDLMLFSTKMPTAQTNYSKSEVLIGNMLIDFADNLINDADSMSEKKALDYSSFASLVERKMPTCPQQFKDTIAFIYKMAETFTLYHHAEDLLKKPYDNISSRNYIDKLQSNFTHQVNDLKEFSNKIKKVEILLKGYCKETHTFWTEVTKLTSLIPEIAKAKFDRFIPNINPSYQYLLKQSGPVLADLKSAEKTAKVVLPTLKCSQ